MNDQIALLPTGTSMNPTKPWDSEYGNPDTTIIVFADVVKPTRLRIGTTFGGGGHYPLGSCWDLRHDQQGYSFGIYKVLGKVEPSGRTQGEIPDRKITHNVFK